MVDEQTIRKVASNSRIKVSDEEVENLKDDFESILDMFETLDEVDTDDVEPAFHPVDIGAEARADEVETGLDQDEAFSNTENVEDGKFKGPSV